MTSVATIIAAEPVAPMIPSKFVTAEAVAAAFVQQTDNLFSGTHFETPAVHPEVAYGLVKTISDFRMPLDLDMHYKGDEITQIVSKAIGMEYSPNWSVVDEDAENKLALPHYSKTANTNIYGHIRGVIVDTELGIVLAESFGYTPTVIIRNPKLFGETFTVKDIDGVDHTFHLATAVMKRAFEGVVLRVFWHKGQLFIVTHKRIDSARSRWGSSKYFVTLYKEAGGPTAEQLFDTSKPFSDTCYDFLVVDSALLVGSRQRVTKPYLVLLAERKYDSQRPAEQMAPARGDFTATTTINGSIDESFIHKPETLSAEEACNFLQYGYYDPFTTEDPRMGTGEELIVYEQDADGNIVDIVKIRGLDADFRIKMRGDNPNIKNQFYSKLDLCYPDLNSRDAWVAFQNNFITFPLYSVKAVQQLFNDTSAIATLPVIKATPADYPTRDDRIHLLFLNFLITLPATSQQGAIDMYVEYLRDRDDVIKWLASLEKEHAGKHKNQLEQLELHKRIVSIILAVRDLTEKDIDTGRNYSRKGAVIHRDMLVKDKVRNLILKERGVSLYSLVREMKRARDGEANQ